MAGGVMQKSKPTARNAKKHPAVQRDAMEDIHERETSPEPPHNNTSYADPNRDRAVGHADRTGRHFDDFLEASENDEVD
jgi:hypothetical protein